MAGSASEDSLVKINDLSFRNRWLISATGRIFAKMNWRRNTIDRILSPITDQVSTNKMRFLSIVTDLFQKSIPGLKFC